MRTDSGGERRDVEEDLNGAVAAEGAEGSMEADFHRNPILNSPYEYPARHWEMDEDNQPTSRVLKFRRPSSQRSPIASSAKKRAGAGQMELDLDAGEEVVYETNELINRIRREVDNWRNLPENRWNVTGETARLLRHWRNAENFPQIRPFFCQLEAVETLIWLTEAAGKCSEGKKILETIAIANDNANPDLSRFALKLATGAGKTTVMAMIIVWQTVNAHRHGVSDKFTNGFLVTTPGITIRDRLRVLLPNDPESYYVSRNLAPKDMLQMVASARVVITNYHAFQRKTLLELSKETQRVLAGPDGDGGPQTVESEGQMVSRVLGDIAGLKNVMMINDEAHHCYQHRPVDAEGEGEGEMDADEKEEAKKNEEISRLWISGLIAVKRKMPGAKVADLSATPFFLSGSGYKEGTLFPWTVSDFSLMDALECGIVKLPRIPVDDNTAVSWEEFPKYRDLWKNLKKTRDGAGFCRLRGQKKADTFDPQKTPALLKTAIEVLYSGFEKTFRDWEASEQKAPPCFIIVCQNTTISKIVYKLVSGYDIVREDGDVEHVNGMCELFDNYDRETKEMLARPRTLLIDSTQLEAGESLSKDFAEAAAAEIAKFKQEMQKRTGDLQRAEKLTDEDILREVMNTVGKEGRLGESVRCVVSVSMLTEGWDANTVTHILGVRAFGTQLLCEQVVGRGLRRLNYQQNAKTGMFDAEYADIFGIPFHFTSGVKNPPPIKPPDFVLVQAVTPERERLAVRFPRVMGYCLSFKAKRVKFNPKFDETSGYEITPQTIGPTIVRSGGSIGEVETLRYTETRMRDSGIVSILAGRFTEKFYPGMTGVDKLSVYTEAKKAICQWLAEGWLKLKDVPMDVLANFPEVGAEACEKINDAVVRGGIGEEAEKPEIVALIDDFMPAGSTHQVNVRVSRGRLLHRTAENKSHVNWAVCDSEWERVLCRVLEAHPKTIGYAKNFGLDFKVPYVMGGERREYLPDFLALVDDGRGADDPLHLVIEVKGYRYKDADVKKSTMKTYWIPGVNKLGRFGRWAFMELNDEHFDLADGEEPDALERHCAEAYAKLLEETMAEQERKEV